jgi:hypothetical protein
MVMVVRPLTDRILEAVDVEGPASTVKSERFGPLKFPAWALMVYVRLKFSPGSTVCFADPVNSISCAQRDPIHKKKIIPGSKRFRLLPPLSDIEFLFIFTMILL